MLDQPHIKTKALRLVEIIHWFHQKGWAPATSTNYSFRIQNLPEKEEAVVISRSGVDKSLFQTSDLMLVDFQGTPLWPKEGRASAETLLHMALYQNSQVGAVFHTHSVAATVLSMKLAHQGQVMIGGLEVLKGLAGLSTHESQISVPIFPNDQDMGRVSEKVLAYLKEHPLTHGLLLAGHGLYTWGRDLEEAKRHIEVFEFLFECLLRM